MAGEHSKNEREASGSRENGVEAPDLLLDAPQLEAEEIRLELAKVLKLEIKGLDAELLLEANLEGVVSVLEELVSVIGENPEILRSLLETLRQSLETVGEVVEGSTSDTESGFGQAEGSADGGTQTIRRIVDNNGDVIRSTLDEDGRVLSEEVVDEREEVEATGAAERRARELNVDIEGIEGTGKDVRILVADVEKAAGRE